MIKFSIPGFFTHYKLNKILLDLYVYEKPYVFKDGVKIDSIYDSVPGSYWNGGRVKCNQDTISLKQMRDIINEI